MKEHRLFCFSLYITAFFMVFMATRSYSQSFTLPAESRNRDLPFLSKGIGIDRPSDKLSEISTPPSSWNFDVTENSHTVILPGNLITDIKGQKISTGDFVGLFFKREGISACAGYTIWEGKGTSFPIFGDDATTPAIKDGFSPGEIFEVRIWRTVPREEIIVDAKFAPVGTPSITATDRFITDAVSMILELGIQATLVVDPSVLDFSSSGGNKFLLLTSNTSWSLNQLSDFISVSKTQGAGNDTIFVRCETNATVNSRSGSIMISAEGASSKNVQVRQAGAAPTLTVNPITLEFSNLPGVKSVGIGSNTNWAITKSEQWISIDKTSGSGNDSLRISVSENPEFQIRNGTVQVKLSTGGLERIIMVKQEKNLVNVPESWKFTQTENSHTIILPNNLESDILGLPLQVGDVVGLFYKIPGQQDGCAGYGAWKGAVTTFPVFGDDSGTPQKKEGFATGESFAIRVWKSATQEEFKAGATYAPNGTLGIVNATDRFTPDGFSMINKLIVSKKETLEIPLAEGWNTISSFLVPDITLLDSLFIPLSNKVRFVKNGAGQSYILTLNTNGIGSWNIAEGYRVNATEPGTLKITGIPVNPTEAAIPVKSGWQIIPYYGRQSKNLEEALSGLGNNIEALKDNGGRIYLPGLVNAIGKLIPSQGYRLKAKSNGSFRYPNNYMDLLPEGLWPMESLSLQDTTQYFKLPKDYNTGSSANIIFLSSGLLPTLSDGDEVGVFAADNFLCGVSKFSGSNLAVTVWGDDSEKPGRQGLQNGERYNLKIWKKSENLVYPITAMYSQGNGIFTEDNIEIINSIKVSATQTKELFSSNDFELFPNPSPGNFNLVSRQLLKGKITIQIINFSGQVIMVYNLKLGWNKDEVITFDAIPVPSGIYLVKVIGEKGHWTGKINIQK